MDTIGQRFKNIRNKLSLSQEEFGRKIGLSKSGVSAVENDRTFVSVEILRTLFFDYNINLNYLICDSGEMFNSSDKNEADFKEDILKEVNKMFKARGL
ncbi:MAG: helix-turn-helix transcriptional regulator [bacterium]|nr:helix-turn-helix transcriptional regulator [bacterium]